jgi:hypothetical protein
MNGHSAETCIRLGCHDGRFLSRHHVCECEPQGGEVGTGAGEGATGQDTGTAWVTRSTDCPEAPAQAHLPAATDLQGVACFHHREVGVVRDCPWCDTARLDPPIETTVSSHDIALEVLARLSERSTNGRLRDAIAQVRSALWDEVER